MGLQQEQATPIYQDNEAAIQIALNRGALSKQSRHIDRRVLASRNKVEDGEVVPKYCVTARMLADIGTKALPDAQFVFLRDHINGYALVKKYHPTYPMPPYVKVTAPKWMARGRTKEFVFLFLIVAYIKHAYHGLSKLERPLSLNCHHKFHQNAAKRGKK